jgi:F-type H+-transporting ATPase subunit gamma
MKIVASTKLARAQRAMGESRVYGQTSNKVFEAAETKPLEDKKTLVVVCSSDKGLCGGIHSGLSRTTRRMLELDPNLDLVVIGDKCKAQLGRSNGKNILLSFTGVGRDIPTFADAQAIADQIALLPTDYASVKILYNKFINATSYEPGEVEAYSEEAIVASANFTAYEIDDEELGNLREYALANSLFWALAEGHACEISARRNAMDVRVSKLLIISNQYRLTRLLERLQERWRYDQQIPNPVQQNSTGCDYGRAGRDYHRCNSFRGYVRESKAEDGRGVGVDTYSSLQRSTANLLLRPNLLTLQSPDSAANTFYSYDHT